MGEATTKIICRMEPGFSMLSASCRNIPGLILMKTETIADLEHELDDADGLIIYNGLYTADAAAAVRRHGRNLKWIQFATAGIDNAERHGVPETSIICNAGDVWAPTVAEHAMALMLGLARNVHIFERTRETERWSRKALGGGMFSLQASTVVIVGLGAIGSEVAIRAKAFGARIVGISRRRRDVHGIDEIVPADRLMDALAEADAVVLTLPLTPETRHLINRTTLAAMKPSAILINVSRGDIVDEEALVEALTERRLAGAGLDVFSTEPLPVDSPLRGLDNVILSPHVAGFGDATAIDRLVSLCRGNITKFMAGEALCNVVAIPSGS